MSAAPISPATARAHSNIALIKYWGKRDAALNLPAVGSISITLDALYTDTRVGFHPGAERDSVDIGGRKVDAAPFTKFLDLIRARAGIAHRRLDTQGIPRVRPGPPGVHQHRVALRRDDQGRGAALHVNPVDVERIGGNGRQQREQEEA